MALGSRDDDGGEGVEVRRVGEGEGREVRIRKRIGRENRQIEKRQLLSSFEVSYNGAAEFRIEIHILLRRFKNNGSGGL